MKKEDRSKNLVKFIKKQTAQKGDLRELFEREMEIVAIGRFRICITILIIALLLPIVCDFFGVRGPHEVVPLGTRFLGHLVLAIFAGLSFVPQFRKNTYAFTLLLAIFLGLYSVTIQRYETSPGIGNLALYTLFMVMMGFIMPWGTLATFSICVPLYLFYPLGLLLAGIPLSSTAALQSNLYLIFFIAFAIISSNMNESIRFEEFILRKKMEGENTILQTYQMRLKKAYERMEQLALLDTLTGAYNRSYLSQWLRSGLYNDKAIQTMFTFIMFDIDSFKTINDTVGHQHGDRILQTVANVVRDELYMPAYLFRYGGDEFCIVLPEVDLRDGIRNAERIRAQVEKSPDLFIKLNPMDTIHVTLSIGCTREYVRETIDADFLIRWTDAALLESKRQGRNSVYVFDPDERKIVKGETWLKEHEA